MKKMILVISIIALFIGAEPLKANQKKEYPLFHGKVFNDLYYPLVRAIEWGDPPRTYIVINVYQKNTPVPIDMMFGFYADKESSSPKMLMNYYIKNRNEMLCRHIGLPSHFENGKFKLFVDRSHPKFDKFLLTMDPEKLQAEMKRKNKKIEPLEIPPYQKCDEDGYGLSNASTSTKKETSKPDSVPSKEPESEGAIKNNATDTKQEQPKDNNEDGSIKSTIW